MIQRLIHARYLRSRVDVHVAAAEPNPTPPGAPDSRHPPFVGMEEGGQRAQRALAGKPHRLADCDSL